MDATLCSRLVVEHQARGGWGLCHNPLQFLGRLTVAEGHFLVNGDTVGMVGQGQGITTAPGVVPWTTAPPAPSVRGSVLEMNALSHPPNAWCTDRKARRTRDRDIKPYIYYFKQK